MAVNETVLQVDVSAVLAQHLDVVWPDVEPLLQSALRHGQGEYRIEDIYHALQQGTMQLWLASIGKDLLGCGVTEIINFPNTVVCHLDFVAGENWDVWKSQISVIEDWALSIGCDKLRWFGRKGWLKRAKPLGYEDVYAVMSKTLRAPDARTH